tara:strand:+ start:1038 stop:1739 length:702 start_codon:yes stop_codon:yes gene_type:complete
MKTPMLVLAGGLGSRIKPVLKEVPKALAPIQGKPFLEILLDNWTSRDIKNFIFLLGHKSLQIEIFLEKNFKKYKDCFYQIVKEDNPLGTGGAVANAVSQLNLEGDFFVINADTWLNFDLNEILKTKSCSIGVLKVNDTSRYGEIDFDQKMIIDKFHEKNNKKKNGFINSGFYYLNSNIFLEWDKNPCSLEKDYFPKLIGEGNLKACLIESDFIDIGVPEDYQKFNKFYGKSIS